MLAIFSGIVTQRVASRGVRPSSKLKGISLIINLMGTNWRDAIAYHITRLTDDTAIRLQAEAVLRRSQNQKPPLAKGPPYTDQ